ncbi:hypothetical protein, partial [Ralstonia pseudosolanacearum]|uniref:hypothetical protein n=1 Tax=Ralstonia pseudosolanacearum TaxID=1310165 RepID=UPI001E2A0B68
PGKSRESTQSAGLFTALSVWTVARKRQLAAWRGGFMQQRLNVSSPRGAAGLCNNADHQAVRFWLWVESPGFHCSHFLISLF